MQALVGILLLAALNLLPAFPVQVGPEQPVLRIGWLDNPGSGLVRLAAARNEFGRVGLRVELIPVASAEAALAQIKAGTLDAATVDSLSALRDIAQDGSIAIFSGAGHQLETPVETLAVEETDAALPQRIVVAALRQRLQIEREVFNPLADALIRAFGAYLREQRAAGNDIRTGNSASGTAAGGKSAMLDPNPGYDRLARLWKEQGLQGEDKPRDYLASHVNEEYFCDALYYSLELTPHDPALNHLLNRAVCPPNCCTLYKQSTAK